MLELRNEILTNIGTMCTAGDQGLAVMEKIPEYFWHPKMKRRQQLKLPNTGWMHVEVNAAGKTDL